MCVRYDEPTEAVALKNAYHGTGMLNLYNQYSNKYSLLFITFDLTGIDKTEIQSAEMETWAYSNGGTKKLKVSRVTTAYNPDDGSYTFPAAGKWYRNAQYLNDYFKDYDEAGNKVYLLPTYFVTPTVDAYNPKIEGPALHATELGHFKWAYQLYSLLKYMQ